MKNMFALGVLILAASCGKNSSVNSTSESKFQNLSNLESERVSDLMSMDSKDVLEQSEFPLTSKESILKLYSSLSNKIQNGAEYKDIESHLFLLLESIHNNWPQDELETINGKLNNLSQGDETIEATIKLFQESEGLIPLQSNKELENPSDVNPIQRKLLQRRNIKMYQNQLQQASFANLWVPNNAESSALGFAAKDILQQTLKQNSIGLPGYENTTEADWNLPKMHWKGQIWSQWAGTWAIDSQYIEGKRFGGTKNWAGDGSKGHAYITPNLNTQTNGVSATFRISLITEIKGGAKLHTDGGSSDKTSSASFNIKGSSIIKACNDLNKCAPFVILRTERPKLPNGTNIEVKLNGTKVGFNQNVLINRTNADSTLEIIVSGNRSHTGKSSALYDELSMEISLIQEGPKTNDVMDIENLKGPLDYLKVMNWARSFKDDLIKHLQSDNAGTYIFRHIKYLDLIFNKESLSVSQLSAIKVLNSYIIDEASVRYLPIINRLINEKKRTISRLPTEEMNQLLQESLNEDLNSLKDKHFEKYKEILSRVELKEKQEDLDQRFEIASKKKYLLVSLYKDLSSKITKFALDLDNEIRSRETEKAQLEHLVPKKEVITQEQYEIY